MPPCVDLDQVSKRFGRTVALNSLTLSVERGQVLGILGPNGAGKSTTLHLLAGLTRPNSGTLSVFGKTPGRDNLAIAPRVGVLFDRPAFYDHLSVSRNLELLARLSGIPVSIDRVLDMVGIVHLANRRAGTLSSGLRQRLGLARALMYEPELLILDEPTSALDAEYAQETLALLRHLADSANVTVILTSHIMSDVETLCDRVAILNQGTLLSHEPAASLISYDFTTVDVLIESPEAAARRLIAEPWVESAEPGIGRIAVRLREENPHQLNAFLLGAGYRVQGILPRRRTLQEYFLKAINR